MRAVMAILAIAFIPGAADARPTLSGTEQTHLSADGHVRLHFTLDGVDAIDATDVAPSNGVPDAVDAAEGGLAAMWSAFVDADGWAAPAPDGGVGGDDRIDVYLRDLDRNGQASVDDGSCFIELDRDVAALGRGVLASIAGHELHHCLQFAVVTGLSPWIYEASATYAQYALFDGDPQVALARDFHWQLRLGNSALAMDAVGNQFEYAGMVWIKYLIDRGGGDRTELLALWQAMAAGGSWESGHDAFLAPGTLDEAAAEYATWAWFACGNDDGLHFDPDVVGCGVPATVMTSPSRWGTSDPIGRRGAIYIRIDQDQRASELEIVLLPHAAMRFQVIEWTDEAQRPMPVLSGTAGDRVVIPVRNWPALRSVAVVATALADGATFEWQIRDAGVITEEDAIDPDDCHCGTSDPRSGAPALAALLLLLVRRRRPRRNARIARQSGVQ